VPRIEISPRTNERLFELAQSFEDTAEAVIERLLDEAEHPSKRSGEEAPPNPPVEGELLPEGDYWLPILEILAERGGASRGRDVIEALGERLRSNLLPRDYEVLRMGEVRWRNRARFARLRMKEQGLISDESPRGIWEITEEGRRYLNQRPPR